MASALVSESVAHAQASSGKCPVDHSTLSHQKTASEVETSSTRIQQDEQGVWHVRGFEEARAVLRSTDTRQAGFRADEVTGIRAMINRPILYQEGKVHQQ